MDTIADIHDFEVSNLINKLIRFIGRGHLENCLDKYLRSLQLSGPVFREYYLRHRHPWWEAFLEYFNLEKSGRSIKANLTEGIKLLAADAKKISTLQKLMPEKIKEKYKRDLIDNIKAIDYLFEIQIAWHFFLMGCKIQWHEDDSKRHSEFLVKDTNFEFNVECKRISVDISRMIRRKDFYRFAEKLLPKIQENGYSGSVEITLIDRLHSGDKFLADLSTQIISLIKSDCLQGTYEIQQGHIYINLHPSEGKVIDFNQHYTNLLKRTKHHSHSAIFAKSRDNQPIDPVEMTISSEKGDNVLSAIMDRVYRAAKKQLEISKPGLICCFLEGIYDLKSLAQDSGLQVMTNHVLSKESLNHIAAVSYTSEKIIDRSVSAENYFSQGLVFRNSDCIFEKAKDYKFISEF